MDPPLSSTSFTQVVMINGILVPSRLHKHKVNHSYSTVYWTARNIDDSNHSTCTVQSCEHQVKMWWLLPQWQVTYQMTLGHQLAQLITTCLNTRSTEHRWCKIGTANMCQMILSTTISARHMTKWTAVKSMKRDTSIASVDIFIACQHA